MPKTKTKTKSSAVKPRKAEKVSKTKEKPRKYFEEIGRRKTATARIRLFAKKGEGKSFFVNERSLDQYFPVKELQQTVLAPLNLTGCSEKFDFSVKVKGGGPYSQAEAVRHGIARALVLFDADFRKKLKKAGYLKRDPRMRERKKFGLKRARKAPQWQKR